MVATVAPDIVFNSPVSFQPFHGRDTMAQVFTALLEVFEEFEYTDQLDGETADALVFRARVGDKQVQGVDLLRFDEHGLISDLTVLVRPLSAVIALAEAMGPRIGHLKGTGGPPRRP
jgi:hypothetical protein